MKKLVLSLGLIAGSLLAKDLPVIDDIQSINIKNNQLTLLNFPFQLKMENIKIMGVKDGFSGDARGNSLYFTLTKFPMNIIVFGGERPIYLTLLETKNKSDKVFNFYNKDKSVIESHQLSKLDQEIVDIFHKIDTYGNLKLDNFYTKSVGISSALRSMPNIKTNYIESYENEKFIIKKFEFNNNYRDIVDLSKVEELNKQDYLLSYTFNNDFLAPNRSTIGYFVFDKSKEL